jgi:hypothetical protein
VRQIGSGKLLALAVASERRAPALPEVLAAAVEASPVRAMREA